MIPKFRAWDKVNKKLKQVYSIDFDKDGEIQSIKEEYTEPNEIYAMFDIGYFELMQSTGLKDNDGIEFYEKDIVRNIDSEELGVVEYDEGQFRVSYNGVSEQLWEIDKDLQIIGNIYENPELLEDN
ncbi:YopX family protein [Staphylococcus epidermidis]|uniref:YopX family protein n=1 Tax=Staphylococcus epidermidis TaxID=1282 RepID=UPI002004C648|nr:YopX family protein [Staphylococcus epidermidis]MCK6071827.1 YopX family protein [Staphylococcus epidermidis]